MNVFNLSYGKDSIAQVLLALEKNITIDKIITADIFFDKTNNILAYDDRLIDFRFKADEKLKALTGITVEHTSADVGFLEQFFTVKKKGNHIGDNYGFPHITRSWCVARLKVAPLKKMTKDNKNATHFIGIARDEPKRYIAIEKDKGKRSLLFEKGLIEYECMKMCERHNLVSPTYLNSFRDGCWFCPKQSLYQLYLTWKNDSQKWNILKYLQRYSFNSFKPNATIFDIEKRFKSGYVPKQKKRCVHTQLTINEFI